MNKIRLDLEKAKKKEAERLQKIEIITGAKEHIIQEANEDEDESEEEPKSDMNNVTLD